MYDEIILEEGGSVEYYEYSENEPNIRTDQGSDVVNFQTIEDNTITEQEDTEEDSVLNVLNEINEKIGELENVDRDSEPVQVVISPDNLRSNNVSNNSIISVSENIINKPLNDYTVSESLLAFVVVAVFVAGLAYVIKRSVFRWN